MNKNLIIKAKEFAAKAHEEIDQRRKYTNEPYISHPASVAAIVRSVSDDTNLICAAWLHDTVEDTKVTLDDIKNEFGEEIYDLVESLTDIAKPEDGNRAKRKEIDRQHTKEASPGAKTVKLADIIHNSESIIKYDQGFAVKFMSEFELLLEVLVEGNEQLYQRARMILEKYKKGSVENP